MLTNGQIQYLFTFCEKHFVKYYDVQVELVDHLANAVETEMQRDPKISFERALEKVHGSFGVMGFAPLVAEKQAAAEKQSRKLFWKLFKHQLGWPKILLFFLLTDFMVTLSLVDSKSLRWFFIFILNVGLISELYGIIQIKRLVAPTKKKFLLGEKSNIVFTIWFLLYWIYFPRIFDTDFLAGSRSFLSILLLSILLSLVVIMIIVTWQTFASVKKNLYKTYPEVFSQAE
jgi:hypothetical protein